MFLKHLFKEVGPLGEMKTGRIPKKKRSSSNRKELYDYMHAKAKRVQETADPMTANHGVSKGLGCCGIYMSHFAPTLASIVDACVITRTLANRSNAPMTPESRAEAMVCDKANMLYM